MFAIVQNCYTTNEFMYRYIFRQFLFTNILLAEGNGKLLYIHSNLLFLKEIEPVGHFCRFKCVIRHCITET